MSSNCIFFKFSSKTSKELLRSGKNISQTDSIIRRPEPCGSAELLPEHNNKNNPQKSLLPIGISVFKLLTKVFHFYVESCIVRVANKCLNFPPEMISDFEALSFPFEKASKPFHQVATSEESKNSLLEFLDGIFALYHNGGHKYITKLVAESNSLFDNVAYYEKLVNKIEKSIKVHISFVFIMDKGNGFDLERAFSILPSDKEQKKISIELLIK